MEYIIWIGLGAIVLLCLIIAFVKSKSGTKPSADTKSLIGETGIVTEEISNIKSTGTVKLAGKSWKALAADETGIPKNSKVIVKSLNGEKLVVEWVRFAAAIENKIKM